MVQPRADRQIIRTATRDSCDKCVADFEEEEELLFDANFETTAFFCRHCVINTDATKNLVGTIIAVGKTRSRRRPGVR